MSARGIDAVADIITILGSWNSVNTDSRTPTFSDNQRMNWEDVSAGTTDFVYIMFDVENIKTGLYAADFFHKILISCEIVCPVLGGTTSQAAHFNKVVKEITRLIKAAARTSGYASVLARNVRGRYNKDKGVFVGSLDVELLKVTTS